MNTNEQIRTYRKGELVYFKLELFTELVNNRIRERHQKMLGTIPTEPVIMPDSNVLSVEDCYFDFGQHWMYTAVIAKDKINGSSWQALCPADYETLVSLDSISDIELLAKLYVDQLIKNKYAEVADRSTLTSLLQQEKDEEDPSMEK